MTAGRCCEFVDELEPAAIVRRMQEIGRRVDALAVVAVDHPRISEEIERLQREGIPTFALLSDLGAASRAGYIGLDARKAGRTAAWAITRLARRPGAVAIFVGSHRYLDHDTREISLRSYLREHAPDFRLLEPLVDLEQPAVAYDAALTLLRRRPELVGIYSTGGGSEGIIRALLESGRARRGRPGLQRAHPERALGADRRHRRPGDRDARGDARRAHRARDPGRARPAGARHRRCRSCCPSSSTGPRTSDPDGRGRSSAAPERNPGAVTPRAARRGCP